MWWRVKDYNLIVKNEDGVLIAIIKKHSFRYCFFNRNNKYKKVRICIEGNHFIDISVSSDKSGENIINDIKKQMESLKC